MKEDSAAKVQKQKRAMQCPQKPRSPPTPYQLFVQSMSPSSSHRIIEHETYETLWSNMSDVEKQPYFDKREVMKKQHFNKLKQYQKDLLIYRRHVENDKMNNNGKTLNSIKEIGEEEGEEEEPKVMFSSRIIDRLLSQCTNINNNVLVNKNKKRKVDATSSMIDFSADEFDNAEDRKRRWKKNQNQKQIIRMDEADSKIQEEGNDAKLALPVDDKTVNMDGNCSLCHNTKESALNSEDLNANLDKKEAPSTTNINADIQEEHEGVEPEPNVYPIHRSKYPVGCPVWYNIGYSKPCSTYLEFDFGVIKSMPFDNETHQMVYEVEKKCSEVDDSNANPKKMIATEDELAFAVHCPVYVSVEGGDGNEMEGEIINVKPVESDGKRRILYTVMLRGKGGRGMVEEDVVDERVRYKMSLKALQSRIKDIEPCQGAFGIRSNAQGRPMRNKSPPVLQARMRRKLPPLIISSSIEQDHIDDEEDDDSSHDEESSSIDGDEEYEPPPNLLKESLQTNSAPSPSSSQDEFKTRRRKYTGVTPKGDKYRARRCNHDLGNYKFEADAALAYDIASSDSRLGKYNNVNKMNFASRKDYELALEEEVERAGQSVNAEESFASVLANAQARIVEIVESKQTSSPPTKGCNIEVETLLHIQDGSDNQSTIYPTILSPSPIKPKSPEDQSDRSYLSDQQCQHLPIRDDHDTIESMNPTVQQTGVDALPPSSDMSELCIPPPSHMQTGGLVGFI